MVPPRERRRDDDRLKWVEWSTRDVAAWVEEVLQDTFVAEIFLSKEIDGPTLLELDDGDLQTLIGVEDAGQRTKLLQHVMAFREQRSRSTGLRQPRERAGQPARDKVASPSRSAGRSRQAQRLSPSAFNCSDSQPLMSRSATETSVASTMDTRCRGSRYSGLSHSTAILAARRREASAELCLAEAELKALCAEVLTPRVRSAFGRPAVSARGTFSLSPRRTAPRIINPTGPGPAAYASDVQALAARKKSPRATVGRSPRNTTSPHFFVVNRDEVPGPLRAHSPTRIKGGVIPAAKRHPLWYEAQPSELITIDGSMRKAGSFSPRR
eukprot:TRINITY_DN101256_c0_g1_i1.p1 TRINITY_DN101256_c0_g1~~TRINITY_DN101256_c0_g1_i1.p1  ORF type:complete len:325 (-),score=54.14 TRINITY_DN101256_c0_g1_i1:55-1029(-)